MCLRVTTILVGSGLGGGVAKSAGSVKDKIRNAWKSLGD
jgi:hypothetical protein